MPLILPLLLSFFIVFLLFFFPCHISGALASVALSYVSKFKNDRMSNWRPFNEFLNSKRVGLPSGFTGLKQRVVSNVPYFLTNYLFIALVFGLLTLLLAPLLAIMIRFGFSGIYFFLLTDLSCQLASYLLLVPLCLEKGRRVALTCVWFGGG